MRTFIGFCAMVVTMAHVAADAPTKDAEDKTGKVFDGLAELTYTRAKVLSRYAFVATGEKHVVGADREPAIFPFYSLRMVNKKKGFKYAAHCDVRLLDDFETPRDGQTWQEECVCGGRLRVDGGPINQDFRRYQSPKPKESHVDFKKRIRFKVFHFDPFDDIVLPGHGIESYKPSVNGAEHSFLETSKLVSSSLDGFGNAKSKWYYDTKDIDMEIELTQSKNHNFLPIEIDFKGLGFYSNFFSHSRVEWKKVKGVHLPVRVEHACISYLKGKVVENQWFVKIDWLVGDDVPEEFFKCESEDYREPLRKHFDLQFDQFIAGIGTVKADEWITPDELSADWGVFGKQKK